MFHKEKAFTLIEVVVGLALFSIIVMVIISFLLYMNYANSRTQADRESLENARRAMDIITYEIQGATSVYTPTTTANQISLQTTRYLPSDEATTYIDFYVCGVSLCEKREAQDPIILTSNSVQVSSLTFNVIGTSIKINMAVNYSNPSNDPKYSSSTNLTSTVTLRSN